MKVRVRIQRTIAIQDSASASVPVNCARRRFQRLSYGDSSSRCLPLRKHQIAKVVEGCSGVGSHRI
jgi:hypothetical protein